MEESEVYEATKALLRHRGWRIIAGQPPQGSDSVPCIEIKSPQTEEKGSRGSLKPDLVATKAGILLLIECKPSHCEADAKKLREVLENEKRVELLHFELSQRKMVLRFGLPTTPSDLATCLRGALAHSGKVKKQRDLAIIHVTSPKGDGTVFSPFKHDPLFERAIEQ